MASCLCFTLFGGCDVHWDAGPPMTFATRKAKALLAYLALSPGAQRSREHLATVFWERSADEQARASLRQTLSGLRKSLSAQILAADAEVVSLDESSIKVDAVEFERLVAQGTPEALQQGAALYVGDFLEGFSLRGEVFEEWLGAERRRFHALAVRGLSKLLAHYETAGAIEDGIEIGEKLLAVDPLQENVHRALMRLYAQDRRRGTALKQYETCVRILRDQLGVDPEAETKGLHKEIMEQRWPLGAPPEGSSEPTVSSPSRVAIAERGPALKQKIQFCVASDAVRLAYATVGHGPPLVKAANWLNHLEYDWESPVWRHLLEELAKDHLLVRYDERGNGLSDWNVDDISFEAFVRDLETVVDAVDLERFALLGISQGCAVSIAYAVRHPERVTHLVLYGGYARGWRKRGSQEVIEQGQALLTLIKQGWGRENPAFRQVFASLFMPDATTEQMQWFNELQRISTSSENAVRIREAFGQIDVSPLLPQVSVPTLVLHCRDEAVTPFEEGRRLAMSIPGARFVALEGHNHLILEHEPAWQKFLTEVGGFLPAVEPGTETEAPYRESSRRRAPEQQMLPVSRATITAKESIERGGRDAERKLAAILYADVAGYSRLTGEDEAGTHHMLSAYLDAISASIKRHHGNVVHYAGDALLADFTTVSDALSCAVEIQCDLKERNEHIPDDRKVQFRIGVNLGEVIVDRNDIYGDGVNVAARLESLAEPGGVCVSESVRSAIGRKLPLTYEFMGEQSVKNIAQPLQAYRVLFDLTEGVKPASPETPSPALPDKPSVAVLPFTNMSGDPEQDYFSDGITEDIITDLSRNRWLFVIARNSTFFYKGKSADVRNIARELGARYIVVGSVRKAGDRVRIAAQLVDARTGNHIWAQRYDRELHDVFAVQDEIAEMIAAAIEPELGKAERERAGSKRPENLDAWDVYQRGLAQLYQYTKEGLREAQRLFREAIELDPNLGAAFSASAEAYYIGSVYGLADSLEENRAKALAAARRGVELDNDDAAAHCTLGRVYYLRREHELAIPELEKALELNPSFAWAHYGIGAAMVFTGRAKEGIPYLENAIRLSPRDPYMGSFLVRMADACLFMRQYDKAVQWARKSLREPHFQWSRHGVLVSALGHLGRLDESRRALETLLQLRPDFTLDFVRRTHLISDTDDMAHYLDGLRKAGLPE